MRRWAARASAASSRRVARISGSMPSSAARRRTLSCSAFSSVARAPGARVLARRPLAMTVRRGVASAARISAPWRAAKRAAHVRDLVQIRGQLAAIARTSSSASSQRRGRSARCALSSRHRTSASAAACRRRQREHAFQAGPNGGRVGDRRLCEHSSAVLDEPVGAAERRSYASRCRHAGSKNLTSSIAYRVARGQRPAAPVRARIALAELDLNRPREQSLEPDLRRVTRQRCRDLSVDQHARATGAHAARLLPVLTCAVHQPSAILANIARTAARDRAAPSSRRMRPNRSVAIWIRQSFG